MLPPPPSPASKRPPPWGPGREGANAARSPFARRRVPKRRIGQDLPECVGDPRRGAVVLDQFRQELLSGGDVGKADAVDLRQAAGDLVAQPGGPVDDDRRRPEQGKLERDGSRNGHRGLQPPEEEQPSVVHQRDRKPRSSRPPSRSPPAATAAPRAGRSGVRETVEGGGARRRAGSEGARPPLPAGFPGEGRPRASPGGSRTVPGREGRRGTGRSRRGSDARRRRRLRRSREGTPPRRGTGRPRPS